MPLVCRAHLRHDVLDRLRDQLRIPVPDVVPAASAIAVAVASGCVPSASRATVASPAEQPASPGDSKNRRDFGT
jgi:hypothetical protein